MQPYAGINHLKITVAILRDAKLLGRAQIYSKCSMENIGSLMLDSLRKIDIL